MIKETCAYTILNSKNYLMPALVAPLLLISLAITINQPITQAFATTSFDQGWKDGEQKAISTYLNDGTFSDKFGLYKHSVAYCQGYKIGYRVGWTNAQLLN